MAMSKGCTITLIILAVIAVIIIAVVILIWLNKDKIMEAGINYIVDQTETEIIANLPDGYTAEEVSQIMADFKQAVNDDRLEGAQVEKLASTFQDAMADQQLDKEEGRRLLVMIQETLGQEPPPMPEEEILPDSVEAVPDSI